MKKNILITGSTDGIGKLLALQLAGEGHRIFIHGRNEEKVNKVLAEIKKAAKNVEINGFVADLSNLDAVRKMAKQVNDEVSHIDVLINNAGVFKSPISLNKHGLELRFVVNYLAPYLLTKEIMPVIKKGTDSRIINLSSAAQASVSYDVIVGKKDVSVNESYAQSKLALTMWSFDLAKKLDDIAVIAVNPGSLLNTKMANEAYGQYWSSADKGSNILYELAVSQNHKGITGKYFDNDKGMYADAHPDAYNEGAINQLIKQTEKLVE
nr:SDR family NAD(P)-dependent oxidoreductase [uncultured Marinifilum sp.]